MTEFNPTKFKQTLHYIIEKVPRITLNQLEKLMYFVDFNYYEIYEKSLTGEKYIKENDSTVKPEHISLLSTLNFKCYITEYHHVINKKYVKLLFSLEKPELTALSAIEIKHIDDTINRYGSMCYDQLTAVLKKDLPFIVADTKNYLLYEHVFYRSAEMSVRDYVKTDKKCKKEDKCNKKHNKLPHCHHEWKWNVIPFDVENPCDGDKKENCGKCPYYVGIKDYLKESEGLIEE